MKELLTISGLIISLVCSGQGDSLQSKIYADFINADIRTYDSMFSKRTELVFVTTVDKFNPTIDTKYLQDYLSDNIDNNEFYKNTLSGQDPTVYFDMPPTFGLGKQLKEDKELGQLLIKLFQEKPANTSNIDNINTTYRTKVIGNPNSYFKMGWDKFHKKYQNCYGIIRLSKIVLNETDDRAVLYVENFKGSLDGSGDIIVLKKVNDKWTIEMYINQWVS